MPIHFTWGEAKRRENLRRHGLDFADAPAIFSGPTLTYEDDRFDYGERRFVTPGWLETIAVSLVHTESPERIHFISFRKATRHEEALLLRGLAN